MKGHKRRAPLLLNLHVLLIYFIPAVCIFYHKAVHICHSLCNYSKIISGIIQVLLIFNYLHEQVLLNVTFL